MGCTLFDPHGRRSSLIDQAIENGWKSQIVHTGKFKLFTLKKFRNSTLSSATIYIEGDGKAWLNKTTASPDPTPNRPVALRLALIDPAANIFYLGRPCQYLSQRICHPKYWTSQRYSIDIVASLGKALDQLKFIHGLKSFELIGYSGGGTLAALMAAGRSDIDRLITVAANLDTDKWTELLELSPLSGSLNPVNMRTTLKQVQQFHFVGTSDKIVPPIVTKSYLRKLDLPFADNLIFLEGFSHTCCWHHGWRNRITDLRQKEG